MFDTIEAAIEDIRKGKMIIVVDDENRENEGDLVMAADFVTPEAINFMARYGRGLICLPMTGERLEELGLPLMVQDNRDSYQTAFTVSMDEASCHTGISAFERAKTIQRAVSAEAKPSDFNRPGHVFPLRAQAGGVLTRDGHTEAAVDLAKLAGLNPAGVICEIMKEDGTMARLPQLEVFAQTHGLKLITIEALKDYRRQQDRRMHLVSRAKLPTKHAEFDILVYEDDQGADQHVALTLGQVDRAENLLVRLHSECLTGDTFHSLRCDCGDQLDHALSLIAKEGKGVLVYLRQEGRGIGLANKIKAYALQEEGLDTVEANLALGLAADLREYTVGAEILKDLGVASVRLMTNNPDKMKGLEEAGMPVASREPIEMNHNERNDFYLKTKRDKMGHLLAMDDEALKIVSLKESQGA